MDFRATLVAQVASLKAEVADLRAQLAAATKGRSERADAAWRSTLHEAKRLVREPNWEWHRLAAAELAAERRATDAVDRVNPVDVVAEPAAARAETFESVTGMKATAAGIARAAAIARGEVTPLPTSEAARAILRASAKAKNEE
jgi:hypothetical protein